MDQQRPTGIMIYHGRHFVTMTSYDDRDYK